LARDGHIELWIIPLLMLAVLFLALARRWREKREISAVVTLVAGLTSAYLMNRERVRADNSSGLIAVSLSGWFWLSFGSAMLLVILSVWRILKRAPSS
jgi:asparagine N-glycosylation enzyme membrane subunit Stt3